MVMYYETIRPCERKSGDEGNRLQYALFLRTCNKIDAHDRSQCIRLFEVLGLLSVMGVLLLARMDPCAPCGTCSNGTCYQIWRANFTSDPAACVIETYKDGRHARDYDRLSPLRNNDSATCADPEPTGSRPGTEDNPALCFLKAEGHKVFMGAHYDARPYHEQCPTYTASVVGSCVGLSVLILFYNLYRSCRNNPYNFDEHEELYFACFRRTPMPSQAEVREWYEKHTEKFGVPPSTTEV